MSRAACTTAQAIRCVNESLRPLALMALRRSSSSSTGRVRKLVAVGIERLSFMKRTSVAAGPRIGVVCAAVPAAIALHGGEHVLLQHPSSRAGARDGVEIEAVCIRDARRHRSGVAAVSGLGRGGS